MERLKKVFKYGMLANIYWLILGIIATSNVFFTAGYIEYNPTVLNITIALLCGAMFIFSTLLVNSVGLFKKIFGY